MQDELYGATVISTKGIVKQKFTNSNKISHDDLLYQLYPKLIDKVGLATKKYYENIRYTGLWPNAAILTRYYNALVIIENDEYKVNLVFIPEKVNKLQINNFKRIFLNSKYVDYTYGDRTINNKRFSINSIKHEGIDYIINILEMKQENRIGEIKYERIRKKI